MHSASDTTSGTPRNVAAPDTVAGSGAHAAASSDATVPARDVSHESLLPYLTRIMAAEPYAVAAGDASGDGSDAGDVDAMMAMYMSIREAEAPLSLQTVQEVVAACFHAGRADSALGVVTDVLLKGLPHPHKSGKVVGADLPLCHQVRP